MNRGYFQKGSFTMKYINSARYLPGDITVVTERLIDPKENNAELLQSISPSFP